MIRQPVDKLFSVGVKTTCKDRWRQVLNDGKRVSDKHMMAVELGISAPWLEWMRESHVTVVAPELLHGRCLPQTPMELLTVAAFVDEVGGVSVMADVHSAQQRSRNMAAVKGKNTKPEMIVRRLLHRLGYRYRLHRRGLPGRPDLLFPARRKAIFVHGCFWHCHACRHGLVVPATRTEFWQTKRKGNVARDEANVAALRAEGWEVHVAWECEMRDLSSLTTRLVAFLDSGSELITSDDRRTSRRLHAVARVPRQSKGT